MVYVNKQVNYHNFTWFERVYGGGGYAPSQKIFAFFASKSHVCDALSDTLLK